jgi:subtilisin family serine protease
VRRLLLAALALALVAAPASAAPKFVPNDPLYARQWYLVQDHAFDFWSQLPVDLTPVRVAVIDSGIDDTHPEFAGRILAEKSFVGGSVADTQGHGTFVAGEIAAATNNALGIAGIAFPAELLIAKVVEPDGTISPDVEARAIRWAVDQGARVINLSLGGLRDPGHPERDTYSRQEEQAIEYARSSNVVVVAAVGNGDEAPSSPWPYASYPAALPHVLGVSALSQDGNVPGFSNRDAIYNDISAPGDGIISTFPHQLTAERPACTDQGYSDCGPPEYRDAQGTSFAAAQVAAAAALLISERFDLTSDQVTSLLEHTALDVNPATGCPRCARGRDLLSGWGRLDIAAALQAATTGPLPEADHFEPNDDAGTSSYPIYGVRRSLRATIDYWDDPVDVYRVRMLAGQRLVAQVRGAQGESLALALWKPGTKTVLGLGAALGHRRAIYAARNGPTVGFSYRARVGGWFYVEVKITSPGYGGYTIQLTKAR